MKKQVQPIPPGFHALTPHLVVKDASNAIEFYKKAFGAKEIRRAPSPDGKSLMHAELQIGDSRLMLVDEFPEMDCRSPKSIGGTPVTIHMFVEDVDAAFSKAVAAGAEVKMPLDDMFWGDRCGMIVDPEGNKWMIATHKSEPTEAQMAEAMRQMLEQAPQSGAAAASN